jgi:hypothetical protein
MPQNAIMITVSIMLALIVKAALETAFKPFFDSSQTWQSFYGLPLAQLCVFFLLTFRFYLGALRFSNTEPKKIDFLIRTFNFVFAFMVFAAFYVIALAVTLPKYFYLSIVALHVIDAIWFGLLWVLSFGKFVPNDQLEVGEFPIEPIRRIMVTYFVFSLLTIGFGLLVYPFVFTASLTDPTATAAHVWFLIILVAISFLDFWWFHEYYFYFEKWRGDKGKK